MYEHSDIFPLDGCKNLQESYGEICVRCNKCGRFGGKKMNEEQLLEIIRHSEQLKTLHEVVIMINEYLIQILNQKKDLLPSNVGQKEAKLFMLNAQMVILEEFKDDILKNIADQASIIQDIEKGGQENEGSIAE